jgi:hypothetical protein
MEGGEGFTKRPRRVPRPKKEPIRREGVRPGKTSYEKAKEGRTGPEAEAPASPEGGAPPTPSPEPFHWSPFRIVAVVIGGAALVFIISLLIIVWQSAPTPSAQEGSVPQTGADGAQTAPAAKDEGVTQPVAAVEHWVSATPGKGLKIWTKFVDNPPSGEWYEYDIDMRLEGTTLTVISTCTDVSFTDSYFRKVVGRSYTSIIKGVKDNGTTIDFTDQDEEGEVLCTNQLTRTADGHLVGSYCTTPDDCGTYFEGTYDLVAAP